MDVEGIVEVGHWCLLQDDIEVLIKPTKKVSRFRITVRKRPKEKQVRHRRYRGRYLTEGPEIG